MIALIQTMSGVEFAWIIVALIGAVLSAWNVIFAYQDMRAINILKIEDDRRIIARAWIYTEGARLIIQALFVLCGVWLALQPEVPTHMSSQVLIRAVFIFCSLLLSFKSIMHWQVRMVIRSHAESKRRD